MMSIRQQPDPSGHSSNRTRNLLFILPAVFFGLPCLQNLAHGHYYASYWYALPTIASVVMVVVPTQRVVVRMAAPHQPVSMPWQTYLLTTTFLTWVLEFPTVAVLRHTVRHHHEMAVLLAVVIPAFVAVGLILLLHARMARATPSLLANQFAHAPLSPVDKTGRTGQGVSGSVYGSFLWLWVITASGAIALFGLIGLALSTGVGPVAPALIGIAIGMAILCVIMRRMIRVSVDESGVRVVSSAWELVVLWDDVVSVEPHLLSGKLVLREPIRAGLVTRRKLPFAMLDPEGRNRPTSRAILARVEEERGNRA